MMRMRMMMMMMMMMTMIIIMMTITNFYLPTIPTKLPVPKADTINDEGCCFTTAQASQMEGEHMASFLPSEQPQFGGSGSVFFWLDDVQVELNHRPHVL